MVVFVLNGISFNFIPWVSYDLSRTHLRHHKLQRTKTKTNQYHFFFNDNKINSRPTWENLRILLFSAGKFFNLSPTRQWFRHQIWMKELGFPAAKALERDISHWSAEAVVNLSLYQKPESLMIGLTLLDILRLSRKILQLRADAAGLNYITLYLSFIGRYAVKCEL